MVIRILLYIDNIDIRMTLPSRYLVVQSQQWKQENNIEICFKLIIKTQDQGPSRRSGVFIDNFQYISYIILDFLLHLSHLIDCNFIAPTINIESTDDVQIHASFNK